MIEKIRKRDGRIVEFDKSKIANAVIPTAICGIEAGGTAYRMDGVSLRLRKMIESKHLDDEEVLEKITSRVKKMKGEQESNDKNNRNERIEK